MPSGPAATRAPRNPFDTAVKPGRSLFDRVESRSDRMERSRDREGKRNRSRSPGHRSNVRKPAPEGIDRYVPGENRSRSRSPARRRGGGGGRRGGGAGAGEGRRGGPKRDDSGRAIVQGRPRFTAEELDKDMFVLPLFQGNVNG